MFSIKRLHQFLNLLSEGKGVGRKISREGGTTEKRLKNSKKRPKIALLSLFQGGGQRKKDQKIAKKYRKIALYSLYLLYLYHK